MFVRPIAFLVGAALLSAAGHSAQAQMPPCAAEFQPLRDAVEREGKATKALVDRKAPREEVCTQIKKFVASEAKYTKFLTDNQSWCGIPPEIVQQVKANHVNTQKLRTQACSAAPMAARPGPPPGPGLSEALGTARGPSVSGNSDDKKPGRGTYDTLTGNPFR